MTITFAVLGLACARLAARPEKNSRHPVCAVGKLISAAEKVLRRIFPATPASLTFAGILLWLITCGVSFAVPFFALAVSCELLARFCRRNAVLLDDFRTKSLADAVIMFTARSRQSLEEGRTRPSRGYVGRDTAELSEEGVVGAAVETVAKNPTDGVVSPLVFMLIGGASLGACCTRRSTR